uniref:Replication polyprotein n=1 Tax=Broom forkmoss associated tymo-like virus TaxID=2933121 RepID=A0A9C7GWK0_9VIRU|nr:replication polyprotein [Broom forkmoss associated tymo-like virus]CAI5383900.1 replication polyprotein [Broom forkmoss associated tymo-like virus]
MKFLVSYSTSPRRGVFRMLVSTLDPYVPLVPDGSMYPRSSADLKTQELVQRFNTVVAAMRAPDLPYTEAALDQAVLALLHPSTELSVASATLSHISTSRNIQQLTHSPESAAPLMLPRIKRPPVRRSPNDRTRKKISFIDKCSMLENAYLAHPDTIAEQRCPGAAPVLPVNIVVTNPVDAEVVRNWPAPADPVADKVLVVGVTTNALRPTAFIGPYPLIDPEDNRPRRRDGTVVSGRRVSHRRPGFCYLRLFKRVVRDKISVSLGPLPSAAAIVFIALRYPRFMVPASVSLAGSSWHTTQACLPVAQWIARLATRPGLPVGAPRATHSAALELLGGTIHKDAVYDSYTGPTIAAASNSNRLCPNHVPEPLFTLLQSAGLPVDPNAAGAHPHPAMKAIEECMLDRVSHKIKDACSVMFMKPEKFKRIQKSNNCFTTLVNPVLSAKDTSRYTPTLSRAVAEITTPSVFLHDTGHYLTPADVSHLFRVNPSVQRIFFTAFLPDELLLDEPSWRPLLYQLLPLDATRYAVRLMESADKYEQPYASLVWLRTNAILCPSTSHGVELLETIFAHKLFVVTRTMPSASEAWHICDSPDDVTLPPVQGRDLPVHQRRVPRKVFQSVLAHSLSLSNRKLESTIAKVRTFQDNPAYSHINLDTWLALAHTCFAHSLDPASLDRGPRVHTRSGLFLRKLKHFINSHEDAAAFLQTAIYGVSWLFFLLPLLGITSQSTAPSPSAPPHVGTPVPGTSLNATAATAVAFQLVAFLQPFTSNPIALALIQAAALAAPAVAHALPTMVGINPSWLRWAVPVAGVALATACQLMLRSEGSHHEVADLLRSLPQREHRRWKLHPVRVFFQNQRLLWTFDAPPPPYTPGPSSATDDPPSCPANNALIVPDRLPGCKYAEPTVTLVEEEIDLIEFPEPRLYTPPTEQVPPLPDPFVRPEERDLPDPIQPICLRTIMNLRPNQVLEPDLLSTVAGYPIAGFVAPIPNARCLLTALSAALGMSSSEIWRVMCLHLPREELDSPEVAAGGLTMIALLAVLYHYHIQARLLGGDEYGLPDVIGWAVPDQQFLPLTIINIRYSPGHWSYASPRGAATQSNRAKRLPAHRTLSPFETDISLARDWANQKLISEWYSYEPSAPRAKPYVRDLKAGTTGTLLRNEGSSQFNVPPNFCRSLDSMVDNYAPRKVLITTVYGAPGSSKSSGILPVLNDLSHRRANTWKLALPRVALRTDWQSKLNLGKLSWKAGTFETNIFKSGRTLIIDEISQFPPGYVDACLIKDASIESVVLIGDVTQGHFHEPNVDATLNLSVSEAFYFSTFVDQYRYYSNSIPRSVASAIGLPTRSSYLGYVRVSVRAVTTHPIIVASESEQKLYTSQGYRAFTFGTVQGQRFQDEPVQIVVTQNTAALVARGNFCCAMTRSNVGVIFIMAGTVKTSRLLSSDPFFAGLFCGQNRYAYKDLFLSELSGFSLMTPPNLFDPVALNEASPNALPFVPVRPFQMYRGSFTEVELPLERAPPGLSALLSAPPDALPEHPEYSSDVLRGPSTSGFFEPEEYLLSLLGTAPERAAREEYNELEQSQQFDDAPWFLRKRHTHNIEQLFPRHRASDRVTFSRTLEKRLRFASQATNKQRWHSRSRLGPILFDGWCRTTGVEPDTCPAFDPDLYARCILENEFTKLTKKTQATLMNNADRSDPDWRHTYVRIFLKSQLKVKSELLCTPFKAGQTLASFQDSVILITGPLTRYLTAQCERRYSQKFYYHPGHSPLQLSQWCQEHWEHKELNTTNDYTAYDQSQTGEALALELAICSAFNIPDHVIDYYVELKLGLTCQFGELAVMRFTGEGPTLLFNSFFNAAIIGCQYALPPSTAVCVAGDDCAINGSYQERPGWPSLSRHLTLVAKPEVRKAAPFCSWLLTSDGAIKSPLVVFCKLLIAQDRGEEHLVLPSLLAEVAVGYLCGDHVYKHLTEAELGFHFFLVRHFVTHASLRFRLMLTTRTVEDVLRHLCNAPSTDLRQFSVLADAAGAIWMMRSGPARLAAALMRQYGVLELRSPRSFDILVKPHH